MAVYHGDLHHQCRESQNTCADQNDLWTVNDQLSDDTYRGLGAVICDKFAAEGCNVAINYVSSKEAADKLASEIKSKHSINAITLAGVSRRRHIQPDSHAR